MKLGIPCGDGEQIYLRSLSFFGAINSERFEALYDSSKNTKQVIVEINGDKIKSDNRARAH